MQISVISNHQPTVIGHPVSPFLSGTNRPSRKAWDHSIFSSASIRLNSARQIRSHVPSSDHCFNRRQQGGGRTILPGHVRPSTTGFQDVENSVQGFSRICGRTSGSRFWFGKKRFNHSPLFVCQLMSRTHTSIFHFTLADHVFEIACKDAYTLQPLPPFPL